MKKTFLDYYKEILQKVSFDPHLLNKEYQKAIKTMSHAEARQFEKWAQEKGLSSLPAPAKSKNKLFI